MKLGLRVYIKAFERSEKATWVSISKKKPKSIRRENKSKKKPWSIRKNLKIKKEGLNSIGKKSDFARSYNEVIAGSKNDFYITLNR